MIFFLCSRNGQVRRRANSTTKGLASCASEDPKRRQTAPMAMYPSVLFSLGVAVLCSESLLLALRSPMCQQKAREQGRRGHSFLFHHRHLCDCGRHRLPLHLFHRRHLCNCGRRRRLCNCGRRRRLPLHALLQDAPLQCGPPLPAMAMALAVLRSRGCEIKAVRDLLNGLQLASSWRPRPAPPSAPLAMLSHRRRRRRSHRGRRHRRHHRHHRHRRRTPRRPRLCIALL